VVLLFQVGLVAFFGQRDGLAVPGCPLPGFVPGDEQDRVAPGVEDIQDAYLAAPGGAGPQFLEVGEAAALDAVRQRPAELGPGFQEQADGLATRTALGRSRWRRSCSQARTSDVMTRA
jgi:hypothetical protein